MGTVVLGIFILTVVLCGRFSNQLISVDIQNVECWWHCCY